MGKRLVPALVTLLVSLLSLSSSGVDSQGLSPELDAALRRFDSDDLDLLTRVRCRGSFSEFSNGVIDIFLRGKR